MSPARSVLLVVAASLALAGCGGSHAAKRASLSERVHTSPMLVPEQWKVACNTHRHACAMSWNASLYRTRSNWPNVLPELSQVEDEFPSVRHLRIKLEDPRTRRVTSFTCVVNHSSKPGSYPWPCAERVRPGGSTRWTTIRSGPGT